MSTANYDKSIARQVFSFSAWLSLSCGAGTLKDYGGNIILNVFYGLSYNASNGIANQVKNLLISFASNIGTAISPQITKAYAANNLKRAIDLTLLLTKFQSYSLAIIILPIFAFCPYLLELWLIDVPVSAVLFVRLMACITYVTTMTLGSNPLYLAVGDIKNLQITVSLIGIFNLPICYIVYWYGGCPATYLMVTLCIEVIVLIVCYWFLKMKVNFPLNDLLIQQTKIISIAAISFFLSSQINNYLPVDSFVSFIVNLLFIEIVIIVLIYRLGMNKKEREYILNFIKNKINIA